MDGRRLSFEEVGIYNGVFVMMDHQTKSFWSHYTGEGIRGPLQGKTLTWIQLERSTWSRVATEHPTATVPSKSSLQFRDTPPMKGRQTHMGNDLPNKFVPTLPADLPTTLGRHEHGVGLAVGRARRFYPLDRLYESELIHDTLGEAPIVVFIHDGSASAAAYGRCVEGRTLTFKMSAGVVVDTETGTRWSSQGLGVDGPLKGKQLASVRAIITDWYGWAAYFPSTTIFAPSTKTPAGD